MRISDWSSDVCSSYLHGKIDRTGRNAAQRLGAVVVGAHLEALGLQGDGDGGQDVAVVIDQCDGVLHSRRFEKTLLIRADFQGGCPHCVEPILMGMAFSRITQRRRLPAPPKQTTGSQARRRGPFRCPASVSPAERTACLGSA